MCMNRYIITSPSINSMLTDGELSFEGIRRPTIILSLAESLPNSREHITILERYFADIHNLFNKKLNAFSESESMVDQDAVKLQALLQEMIKVKGLIEAASLAAEEKGELEK